MSSDKAEPLTEAQEAQLEAELAELEGPRRAAAVEAIARARSFGDLTENFEYHAAKNEQGLLARGVPEAVTVKLMSVLTTKERSCLAVPRLARKLLLTTPRLPAPVYANSEPLPNGRPSAQRCGSPRRLKGSPQRSKRAS